MLQELPPELMVYVLGYCNYTTNSRIKCLNKYFHNFYHDYFNYIIKEQYNIHPSSIKHLYSLIQTSDKINETSPISNLIWIKGTLLWNYIDKGSGSDFSTRSIPSVLYPHIHINTVITFRHNPFSSFDFPINCTLETLSYKLYIFWNISQILNTDFKIYFISGRELPHRIDFNANRHYYPYFTFWQRQILRGLNYVFRLVS